MIAGARYVSINELQAGDRLDEQTVKLLAGREPISARFLYQELFEYMPTFTAWMRTNHKPIITGEDDGIWRRLVILPFKRKFIDEEKDPYLEDKLMAEADGILQWMLEGSRKYFKDGLQLSKTIKAEHASYRKESDMLGEFLEDQTEIAIDAKESQSDLFYRWRNWCESNGVRHGSKKTFTQRLAERGFSQCESARTLLKQGINDEYQRMKTGHSTIEPILDQILALIDAVLAAAGLVSSQLKPQPKPQ